MLQANEIPEAARSGAELDRWALDEARRLATDAVRDTGIAVYLFGSRARGTARRFADIDIAIALAAGDRPVPRDLLALLREQFEESRIPYRVDLVDLYHADPSLRGEVAREGVQWTTA